jgi:hypothetical protein
MMRRTFPIAERALLAGPVALIDVIMVRGDRSQIVTNHVTAPHQRVSAMVAT